MKVPNPIAGGRAQGLLLLLFIVSLFPLNSSAQAPASVSVRLSFYKVDAIHESEFLAAMKDVIKPTHQLRKTNGKIINWRLYKVHHAGKFGDYNYVSVSYYDSFDKTEPNDDWPALLKAANPKLDVEAFRTKYLALRTPVTEAVFSMVDNAVSKTPVTYKYVEISYMKAKPGKEEQYVKCEREDWKPMHQHMIDNGIRASWGLWVRNFPGGAGYDYDYVTSNGYSTYSQIDDANFEEVFKKVFPGKNIQEIIDRTIQSRDLVHAELWELKESL